jgi:signal transduction histidine kinase
MRLLLGAAAVCLLLALLTWLLVEGAATDASGYAATLRRFDNFALAEASLHRDVLQARAGLLADYDPLNSSMEQMDAAVARLRSKAAEEGLDAAPLDRLAAATAREEELTERFKSNNALLRNSLAYVSLLSMSPDFINQNAQLAPSIGGLAAAILHLTLDSSEQARQSVQDQLAHIATQAPAAGSDATQALIEHARLLHDLLPTVDETLKALLVVPSAQPLKKARSLFSNHNIHVEASAQRFRVLLYGTSLLLVVALFDLGRRLRVRAVALQRQAAFEHVVAENSTRLINCPPADTEARLKQALGELGKAMRVDRVYFVLAKTPIRICAWSVDDAPYPPGWPEAALALPAQLNEIAPGVVALQDVATLPPGDAKKTLTAFGVKGWACVSLLRPGFARAIVGFDTLKPTWDVAYSVAAVRLAGDAIVNAIERQFLERDRARLAMRLERARRLQMVGQLASGVAHNFNNIIGAILGYSEIAEAEIVPGTKPAQHIGEIRRAAERGRDLVDSILTFGRQHDTHSRLASVRAFLDEAASLLRASLPPGIDLVIAAVPSKAALFGEPAQLQQIILNLCNNASQAMEGHGVITVSASEQLSTTQLTLSHGELAPGRYVRIDVSDSGPGFGEDVARRLFEPFFTTRPAGTGLGLATVRKIVRDHEGAMNVVSALGQGSRFEVWLPAAAADVDTTSRVEDPTPSPLGRGETVLIIEHDRERLLGGEDTLAALGYEPVGFQQAADALAACRSEPARFDAILISDASASDVLNMARTLHDAMPRLPILLASASTFEVDLDALTQVGIVEILRRPLMSDELAAGLARCLRSAAALQM